MTLAEQLARPYRLRGGGGKTIDRACLMQRASLEHAVKWGYADRLPLRRLLTDRPCWANEALTRMAIWCQDYADDETRQDMKPLKARMLTAERREPETERRINARILCAQARRVLHLIPEHQRALGERAIATREAWLAGEASEEDCQAGAKALNVTTWGSSNRGAARAVIEAATGVSGCHDTAMIAASTSGDFDPVEWLEDALDDWEKACAAEGALLGDGEAARLVAEFVQAAGS